MPEDSIPRRIWSARRLIVGVALIGLAAWAAMQDLSKAVWEESMTDSEFFYRVLIPAIFGVYLARQWDRDKADSA